MATRSKRRAEQKRAATAAENMPPLPLATPARADDGFGTAVSVAWAWVMLLLIGFVVFRSDLAHAVARGNEMSVEKAAFTVVNAATLTGFQSSLAIDEYKLPGQLMILALTIGGSLLPLIAGGIAVARIARLPYSDRKIIIVAIGAEVVATIVGAAALLPGGSGIMASLLQAASAFGNSGVWMGRMYEITDPRVHAVLLPLAVLGGLGIPVLLEIYDAFSNQVEMSRHSRVVLSMTAGVYLLGAIAIFGLRQMESSSAISLRSFAAASLASLNTRSAGLPLQFASDFPRATQWLLIVLMAIGASPAGTAGGIKTTTLAKLATGTRDIFRELSPGRGFGVALVWTFVLALLVFGSLLSLLHSEPDRGADYLLFLSVSAAGNVGFAHDRVTVVGQGIITLTIAMFLGRVLPLIVLWWMAKTTREADVAVG